MICSKCSIRRFGGLCDECDSKLDLIYTFCEEEFTLIEKIDFTNETVKEKIKRLTDTFRILGLLDNNNKFIINEKAMLCVNNLYLSELLDHFAT